MCVKLQSLCSKPRGPEPPSTLYSILPEPVPLRGLACGTGGDIDGTITSFVRTRAATRLAGAAAHAHGAERPRRER
eukprot:scaffold60802_cov64-Phaeocystis_antarctica.AAC.1